jgi:osmoprotectant transport system permease protein
MTEWPIFRYLFNNFDRVWPRIVEHVLVSGEALLWAALISLPLGYALSRARGQSLATPVLVLLGLVYTIPSFALFAFLVPFMGIGRAPAVTALAAYALVVLVRNTMVAFGGVDPAVKEAARGMGMGPGRLLWRIELPLALPVLVAGLRIATLATIGLASIAAWIGAGGLGQLLRDGLQDPTYSKLYAGLISIGALAVLSDLVFRVIERMVKLPGGSQRKVTGIRAVTAQPTKA